MTQRVSDDEVKSIAVSPIRDAVTDEQAEQIAALTKERDRLIGDNNEVRLGACILRQDYDSIVSKLTAAEARVKALEAAGDAMRRMWAEDNSDAAKEWDAAVKESSNGA